MSRRLVLGLVSFTIATTSVSYLISSPLRSEEATSIDADKLPVESEAFKPHRPLSHQSTSDLITSYLVYTMCSIPALVNQGPALIDWCTNTKLPFVWDVTEWIVRKTFFHQFVGGDTAEDCLPLASSLSREGLGTMFNYSVEVSHNEAKEDSSKRKPEDGKEALSSRSSAIHRPIVDELLHCIDVAAHFTNLPRTHGAKDESEMTMLANRPDRSGSTFLAIKLSGILHDCSVLERASAAIVPREWFSSPPSPLPPLSINGHGPCGGLAIPVAALTQKDVVALKQLWEALREMAIRARKHGNVRLVIDAEYSWYQPAIDAMYEAIAAEFNKAGKIADGDASSPVTGPLIYNTYQAYLRRTPSHLAASLERARLNGYTLGVKLVRGAYVDIENESWSKKIVETPPVPKGTERWAQLVNSEAWGSPVWPSKQLTDQCFDGCAIRLVDEIYKEMSNPSNSGQHPRLAVVFASHNMQSALRISRRMLNLGLAHAPPPSIPTGGDGSGIKPTPELVNLQVGEGVRGRIFFAQLYGMASVVTCRLQAAFDPDSGGEGPHMILKYLPYGPLKLVLPYLIRRAVENGSIMGGGASKEKKLLTDEMLSRLKFN
ncbi:FAD-linked oxidoreductase [Violaceomyces palustris]|uniref:FAD-linked oxidoreductase n=1 Tax=Violaceomyces palustris TaxID=1673888 RepID=A0ACD0P4T3_9BASI|nr:FAD-linked oxidoreductase [Violaceomyces palustris]